MARCERGYLCSVCGGEVEEITESKLYLQYVLGEVDPDLLHRLPEAHIRCDPVLAQFIVTGGFDAPVVPTVFSKAHLDPDFVRAEESRVTRGYLRLLELADAGLPISDYPLPEFKNRDMSRAGKTQLRFWRPAKPPVARPLPLPLHHRMSVNPQCQDGDASGAERVSRPLDDQCGARPPGDAGSGSSPRVLFLDDDPRRAERFLRQVPAAVWVKSVAECLPRLTETWEEIHLDHDLEGETLVDMNRQDTGMEVIRWLCKEPRPHLSQTRFFVHTHNFVAGLLMVLQMHDSGYSAEFRPFGHDLATILDHPDD